MTDKNRESCPGYLEEDLMLLAESMRECGWGEVRECKRLSPIWNHPDEMRFALNMVPLDNTRQPNIFPPFLASRFHDIASRLRGHEFDEAPTRVRGTESVCRLDAASNIFAVRSLHPTKNVASLPDKTLHMDREADFEPSIFSSLIRATMRRARIALEVMSEGGMNNILVFVFFEGGEPRVLGPEGGDDQERRLLATPLNIVGETAAPRVGPNGKPSLAGIMQEVALEYATYLTNESKAPFTGSVCVEFDEQEQAVKLSGSRVQELEISHMDTEFTVPTRDCGHEPSSPEASGP